MSTIAKEAEKSSRKKLARILYDFGWEEVQFADDKYFPIDGYYISGDEMWVFELKERNFGIDRYDSYLIEFYKWYTMIEYFLEGYNVVYIMMFTDGIIGFNLSARIQFYIDNEIAPVVGFTTRYLPSTSNKEKVREKLTSFLEVDTRIDGVYRFE